LTSLQIPDHIPNEEACTLGVAITTVGQGLYQSLRLPLPGSNTEANCPVLIYGGSTATGSIAIQYAHLSGCTSIVTTCSDRNVAFVKELGAHTAFDYTDPECAQQIRAYTNDSLAHAFDCISTPVSARICSEAIGSTGGTVSYLLPVKHDRKDVRAEYTLAYTAMGEYFRVLGKDFEALDQDLEFARMFWALSADLVSDGHIRAQPQQIGTAGLNGIFEGWQSMRKGTVSGKKLVYRIEDTE
jgi:NADPH:quinone reductase-like Zn-dependent oxidoreductase